MATDESSFNVSKVGDILEQLKLRMKDDNDEVCGVETLDDILNDSNLQSLIEIHESIQTENQAIPQNSSSALGLVEDVQGLRRSYPNNDILSVLSTMLHSSPHLLALLSCHDKIASKTFDEPQLMDTSYDDSVLDDDDQEESMKVVRLVKSDEPLGATIATDDSTGNIIIARILKGGAADRSGLIHVNDILVEVNDVAAKGKKPGEVIKLLAGFRGPLTFKLIPGETLTEEPDECIYVRTRFTYLPQADNLIPCVDAGLNFYPGDILRVVSKDDNSWWQAGKVESNEKTKCSNTNKVGLIPSMKLQARREKLKRQAQIKSTIESASIKGSNMSLMSNGRRTAWSTIRASFRKKKNGRAGSLPHMLDVAKQQPPYFPPYEVVSQYFPAQIKQNKDGMKTYRPIVLVGPQGVGRNELKDYLIDSNPSHYGVPVPHTSRLKQPIEQDGKDYNFVTRDYMENGIREHLFLEYGEYKGNLYGTSLDAVRTVIRSGQVCVLTPYPQALSVLRAKEFMSYVIFIKPPSVLEMGRLDSGEGEDDSKGKLTIERAGGSTFSDEEIKNLVSRAEKMDASYGRLFDATIVNDNSERAFKQLKDISFSLENDPQWVPSEWIS